MPPGWLTDWLPLVLVQVIKLLWKKFCFGNLNFAFVRFLSATGVSCQTIILCCECRLSLEFAADGKWNMLKLICFWTWNLKVILFRNEQHMCFASTRYSYSMYVSVEVGVVYCYLSLWLDIESQLLLSKWQSQLRAIALNKWDFSWNR